MDSDLDRGEMFRANVRAHWLYFRRSRLILIFFLILLVLAALFSLPAMLVQSRVQGFGLLQQLFEELNGLLIFFSAALGLIIISSHLRARNLKMIFTKPCSPALWMASAFVSVISVTLVLDALILSVALILSAAYGIPVQGGLVYVSIDTFFASAGMTAYLMFLAMVMHPALAAAFALVLGPWTAFLLETWTAGSIRAGNKSPLLHAMRGLFHVWYLALPMIRADSEKFSAIEHRLRVGAGQWANLGASLGYALALAALCYCLALFFLHRKQLN